MGIKYLWDTNTVIYYLQQQFPLQSEKLIDELLKDSGPAISVITEIELLCWKTPFENDLKVLNNFIEEAFVIELDRDIKLKTAEIRKVHKVKLPDAVIVLPRQLWFMMLPWSPGMSPTSKTLMA